MGFAPLLVPLLAPIAMLAQGGSGLPYNQELLEKLRNPSPAARREAALDLAKMGADARAAVPDLQKVLVEADAGVRAAAAFALGEIGAGAEPASTALLRNVTSDKDANVRKESAAAIAKIGPKAIKTLPGLLTLFRQESDPNVREAISAALVRVAPLAKETHAGLADALADESPAVRALAARTLGAIGPPARASLAAIEKASKDSDAGVADAAKLAQLRVNGELEDPPDDADLQQKADLPEWKAFGVKELLTLLKSPTPSTRLKAIYQIGKRRDDLKADAKGAALALASLAKDDPEPAVRAAAALALGTLGSDAPELARALGDPDAAVRVAAARALGMLGSKAHASARALAQARLKDPASPVRRRAGEALRVIEKEAAAAAAAARDPQQKKTADANLKKISDEIAKALGDALASEEDVRVRATMCAGELGPAAKETIPQLMNCLKDPAGFVRASAAAALGEMGNDAKNAVAPIEELLKDPDIRVRKRATEALARLGKPVAPPAPPPPVAAAPPKPGETAADSRPGTPPVAGPVAGPAAGPTAEPPKPQPPAGSLAAQVADLLLGEGGITDPTSRVEGDNVTLVLQLAHDRFDEGMAHGDAVRLVLKVFMAIEKVDKISVEMVAHNGRPLRRYRVTRAKATPFFEKLDDPFARRRARDWWDEMAERG